VIGVRTTAARARGFAMRKVSRRGVGGMTAAVSGARRHPLGPRRRGRRARDPARRRGSGRSS
jgi:hypothetical protein